MLHWVFLHCLLNSGLCVLKSYKCVNNIYSRENNMPLFFFLLPGYQYYFFITFSLLSSPAYILCHAVLLLDVGATTMPLVKVKQNHKAKPCLLFILVFLKANTLFFCYKQQKNKYYCSNFTVWKYGSVILHGFHKVREWKHKNRNWNYPNQLPWDS